MARANQLLRTALYGAGIFALIAAGAAAWAVRDVACDVHTLVVADNGLRGTVQDLNSDLVPLGIALDAVGRASDSQARYWDANTRKIGRLLDNANGAVSDLRAVEVQVARTVGDTGAQVNGQVLPQVTEDLRALEAAIAGVRPVLVALQAQASNPDIPATLANLRQTSANVASVTAHTDATAADVQAAVHRWTKPAHSVWWFVKEALRPAVDAVELYHFL